MNRYISRVNILIKKFNYRLIDIIIYIILRLISEYYLKCQSKLLTFDLTNKLPQYLGYELSEYAKQLCKDSCLVLQGPINKKNQQVSFNFARTVKEELGFGCVIYCGPDYEFMQDCCDYSLEATTLTKIDNQFNRQRNSTLIALKLSESLGYKYSLKLRADSIILRRESILILQERLERYKKKFVVTAPQKPYYENFMGDHLQFGNTSDLITLWSREWNGKISIDFEGIKIKDSDCIAKSPEWILGYYAKFFFGPESFSVCSEKNINYIFLKYDCYDGNRFDWESSPHFSTQKNIPGAESNISSIEEDLIEKFGEEVYRYKIKI